MFVKELELRNFRNYKQLRLEFGEGNNVFCGPNGQGKTNVLEAIYLTTCARSHRTGKDKELIKHGESAYCVLLTFQHDNGSSGEICFNFDDGSGAGKGLQNVSLRRGSAKNGQDRNISYNGFPLERLADLFGHFHAVIFAPEDLMLIKEGPGERRRFLDILISQLSPSYFRQLQIYQKVLKQRNAFLKYLRDEEKGRIDKERQHFLRINLDVWDEQLVESAAFIIEKRQEVSVNLGKFARTFLDELSDRRETLDIAYISPPGIEATSTIEDIKERLLSKLCSAREDDIFRGFTSIGPHRDDLDFLLNGLSAKNFASQGQQRSIVLALKIGELNVIEEQCEVKPVLLLDDVMSELDAKRRANLLASIKEHQVFITCTDLDQLEEELLAESCNNRLFLVENASVSRSSLN